jgi:S1-C subfamily serine protease
MSSINSVVQIIVSRQGTVAFQGMVAGTGWFPENTPEGTMLTNAHVVKDAKAIFIRMPCNHTLDIPVHVKGMSTDLDLAVIYLDKPELEQVKGMMKEKYGIDKIPTLKLTDSDKVHPSRYDTLKAPRVYARGYPLGTEYQQVTDGRVSGIKHAREQEYIVTTATINPGNSGGPAVNEEGDVVGINSMKINGAEGINMIIPSNRIKRMLPHLMNNSDNEEELERVIEAAQMMTPNKQNMTEMANLMDHIDEDVDMKEVVSAWNQHSLGGFKRKNGIVTPVLMSEWFKKHVQAEGGHALFSKVVHAIHENDIDTVKEMRQEGFQTYRCAATKCKSCGKKKINQSMIPPRTLHMPRLGYRFSNSSGEPTLKYYSAPKHVKTGIIVSDVVENSMFDRSGVKKYDFIYQITSNGKTYDIDNYGESWIDDLSVSLKVNDIIHRTPFGEDITLHVMTKGGEVEEKVLHYNFLEDKFKPVIRFMDSMHDLNYQNQVVNLAGVVLKTLRMEDVMQHQLAKYTDPHVQNQFKVVVADIDPRSPAFHSRNLTPGNIIAKINDQEVASSWEGFVKQLQGLDHLVLEEENGSITIL